MKEKDKIKLTVPNDRHVITKRGNRSAYLYDKTWSRARLGIHRVLEDQRAKPRHKLWNDALVTNKVSDKLAALAFKTDNPMKWHIKTIIIHRYGISPKGRERLKQYRKKQNMQP